MAHCATTSKKNTGQRLNVNEFINVNGFINKEVQIVETEMITNDHEAAFTEALQANPDAAHTRLVYADYLEERGDPRGELLRLTDTLTQSVEVPDRAASEERLRTLLAEGVQPVGPFHTNSIGMRLAYIPAGTFTMGSSSDEPDRFNDERQHKVTLTKGFYMGVHTVTQKQWQAVMGSNPSRFKGSNLPVETVSRGDCQEFCKRLTRFEACAQCKDDPQFAASGMCKIKIPAYRLPTEAEWEFACRAGTTTAYHFGNTITKKQANFNGRRTTPVGSYPANAFGLHDMHGNVWQWCEDWYGEYAEGEQRQDPTAPFGWAGVAAGTAMASTAGRRAAAGAIRASAPTTSVSGSSSVDPRGPSDGRYRVLRGGSWLNESRFLRSACCIDRVASGLLNNVGLRVVCCLE
jgi:uncharacterized protein (TIGR02996 family)